jgi:hypothetical protein
MVLSPPGCLSHGTSIPELGHKHISVIVEEGIAEQILEYLDHAAEMISLAKATT